MKKSGRLTVVLWGVCAVIWTIRAILEVAYQTYNDTVFLFVLNILCAVMSIAAFVVNLKKYHSNKEER